MRFSSGFILLLFGPLCVLQACELSETTVCEEVAACDALGTMVEVCCTDDGTDMSCVYAASDGAEFACEVYPSGEEMGESCTDAATAIVEYCLTDE